MKNQVALEIFYFDAGGGHRSAMNALKEILADRRPEWLVTPIDLQKLLEPVDPLHRITLKISPSLNKFLGKHSSKGAFLPIQSQEFYNYALKKGATGSVGRMRPLLHEVIRKKSPEIEALLKQHWLCNQKKPDLVVSVIPHFNSVMYCALRSVYPSVPFVTVMTDMVDCPPHFWMEDQNQAIICGTTNAFEQAEDSGFYAPENIFQVSGMILKKKFYEQPEQASLTLEQMGLSSRLPTALVMFGGNGSIVSKRIVDHLKKAKVGIQTIVICGNNKELYESLQNKKGCHAVGFVSNVADYMRLADFMIGKPGPGCISEAMHLGCPVVVERNASTMPQERPNADWVMEKSVGIVITHFSSQIVGAVQRMVDDLEFYKQNIRMNVRENRAVFETVDLFEKILTASHDSNPRSLDLLNGSGRSFD